jgi:preprotein translocase subunit SecG
VVSLPMYLFSYLVLTVVGIITVVLLHRVNRAGWLDPAEPDPA